MEVGLHWKLLYFTSGGRQSKEKLQTDVYLKLLNIWKEKMNVAMFNATCFNYDICKIEV